MTWTFLGPPLLFLCPGGQPARGPLSLREPPVYILGAELLARPRLLLREGKRMPSLEQHLCLSILSVSF